MGYRMEHMKGDEMNIQGFVGIATKTCSPLSISKPPNFSYSIVGEYLGQCSSHITWLFSDASELC